MEAQALGIPVVAYDLPWSQEFIINGLNGYRASYSDISKLSEYIIKATDTDPEKVTRTAKKYDRELTFQNLKNLLNEDIELEHR
jgi:glycosyltransferase involved in cell wall biosynthesis